MANIQNLFIIKAEDGSVVNAITAYDLSVLVGSVETPKEVTGVYIVQNGTTFTEYNYAAPGSKFVTKVTNPSTGQFAYLDESPGTVADLLVNTCAVCDPNSAADTVKVISSCTEPVYVQVCGTGPANEIEFTDAIPICVTNADGTFSTWYTREVIIWNITTSSIVSRTTEYSSNGTTWTTTAPTGSYTMGACEVNCLTTYNKVEQFLVDDSAPLLIPADTVHSISYKVLTGSIDISIDGKGLEYVKGESDMEEATTLISVDYIFTATPGSCVKVKIIKPVCV